MSLSDQALMNQSKDTAHDYMMAAIRSIDEKFGEGYAKNNPQLVGDFMKTATIDYLSCSGLQSIATSLDFVTEQIGNIAESIDCAAAGCHVADSETVISLSEKECILAALKARWIELNPEHTQAQYIAAMNRFEIMAGL